MYQYDHNVERPTQVFKTLSLYTCSAPDFELGTTAKGEATYTYSSVDSMFAGYKERVKYTSSRTKQLYTSNSDIDKTRQSTMREKTSLYTQLAQVWTSKDAENIENPEWDAPVDGSLKVNIPYDRVITEDDVWQFIEDLVSKWIIENKSMITTLVGGKTRLPECALKKGE